MANEYKLSYTASEIDAKLGEIGNSIIDVTELPTENIKKKSLYRLWEASLCNGTYFNDCWLCYCVDKLPNTPTPVTDINLSYITVYYNISNNTCYAHIDENLSLAFSAPVGWYDFQILCSSMGYEFGGIISSLNSVENESAFYVMVESVIYSYDTKWINHKNIGKFGSGANAEIFNYYTNIASGDNSHAEGYGTEASGSCSHAEGDNTEASGDYSHAEGINTMASGGCSHAEGNNTVASISCSHAEGGSTVASGGCSHAEGGNTEASGSHSHAEGYDTVASGANSHAEGGSTEASGSHSHAEGYDTVASGANSHAEGGSTEASGDYSHAEGYDTVASGRGSHAEGNNTVASVLYSHAEGSNTVASGGCSHAEGNNTVASGANSHAEGNHTVASGDYSHAEGNHTVASGDYSHAEGRYNIEDILGNHIHIAGNGYSNDKRSNAHTLDWEGNAWYAGDVYIHSTSGTNRDEGSKKLATEEFVLSSLFGSTLTLTGIDANGTSHSWTMYGVSV